MICKLKTNTRYVMTSKSGGYTNICVWCPEWDGNLDIFRDNKKIEIDEQVVDETKPQVDYEREFPDPIPVKPMTFRWVYLDK